MFGTHRDLLFGSKSRCFASKNHRWGLASVETTLSTLLYTHNTTGGAWNQYSHFILVLSTLLCVLKTTDEVVDQYRLISQVLKSLFCIHNTTGEAWNQYSLFILVLNTLLCVLKTTDEVWDQYRLVSLVLKSLFCMHKTTDEVWDP